jgi:hypothetical protein
MQLIEGIAWRQHDKNIQSTVTTRVAYGLNVLQPIVYIIAVLLFYYFSLSKNNKDNEDNKDNIIILILIVLLVGYSVYAINRTIALYPFNKSIRPNNSCKHINLWWWNNGFSAFAHISTLLVAVFLTMFIVKKEWKFILLQLVFTTFMLLLSFFIVPCGKASMWCWFVVAAPLFTWLTWNKTNNRDKN